MTGERPTLMTTLDILAAKRALRDAMGWHWGGKHTRQWHGLPRGIVGIGFGVKRTNGKAAMPDCIRVYVKTKRLWSKLTKKERIKKLIDGYPTDVIPVGTIRPQSGAGEAIGGSQGIAGTLGCVAYDESGDYLLGSWHVLTNVNGQDGDPVYMPGLNVNGAAIVGRLTATPQFHLNGGENAFDASVARIDPGVVIDPAVVGLGDLVLPDVPPTQGTAVCKQGAATGFTTGVIEGVSEDMPVFYNGDPTQNAILTGQIAIVGDSPLFSDEGDSGAMVCTSDRHPVGLIAGGSQGSSVVHVPHTFASPIHVILHTYQLSIRGVSAG